MVLRVIDLSDLAQEMEAMAQLLGAVEQGESIDWYPEAEHPVEEGEAGESEERGS